MSVKVKGRYSFRYLPVELEWDLPLEALEDAEVFEKIGEEMQRIALFIKKQEMKWMKQAVNQRRHEVALQNLRWLFLPTPEVKP